MNHRHVSAFIFGATVAAAGLAAAILTGGARADMPSDEILGFTGERPAPAPAPATRVAASEQ